MEGRSDKNVSTACCRARFAQGELWMWWVSSVSSSASKRCTSSGASLSNPATTMGVMLTHFRSPVEQSKCIREAAGTRPARR